MGCISHRKNDQLQSYRRLPIAIRWGITLVLLAALIYSICRAYTESKSNFSSQLASHFHDCSTNKSSFYNSDRGTIIAHGGGLGEFLYTNSKEGVLDALSRGITHIELDLLETTDGQILAAHDWDYFRSITHTSSSKRTTPMSWSEAKLLKINGNLTPLNGAMIREIMHLHPEMILVTDKLTNFDLLLKEIPYPERIIVEIFSLRDYIKAVKAGIRHPSFSVPHLAALTLAQEHSFPLIATNASLFEQEHPTMQKLHDKGVCIMVFGIEGKNALPFFNKRLGKSASMVYTATLPYVAGTHSQEKTPLPASDSKDE